MAQSAEQIELVDESGEQAATGSAEPTHDMKAGLAFSGGGIRSAALCSGVLRKILELKHQPGYLSCVSGGGYTGSAYLDWKYRNGKTDAPAWHKDFFNHMRNQAGYICNWQAGCLVGCDTLLVLLLIVLNFVIAFLGWGSIGCVLAFVVDHCFGNILRQAKLRCDDVDLCEPPNRNWVFIPPLGLLIVFWGIAALIPSRTGKLVVKILEAMSGSVFAFTFLPWFIHDYLDDLPLPFQLTVVFLSAVVWFFVPVLRRYSSLVILVYCFSYLIYWRVFKKDLWEEEYTKKLFITLLLASGVILSFASCFGAFHLRLAHNFNRWRLQKAFYNSKSTCGCAGIHFYDFFSGTFWCKPPARPRNGTNQPDALTLHDLRDIKPVYISNTVINGWRKDDSSKSKPFRLLAMTPTQFDVIDHQPQTSNAFQNPAAQNNEDNDAQNPRVGGQHDINRNQESPANDGAHDEGQNAGTMFSRHPKFGDATLGPKDIKLSSAMAMSGAFASPHLGAYEQIEQSFTHILTILGVEMAARIVHNIAGERDAKWYWRVLGCLLNILCVVPPLVLLILYRGYNISDVDVRFLVAFAPTFVVIFMALLTIPTAGSQCCRSFSRWMTVHIPLSRFMRSICGIIETGSDPPAMLHLSDGGHFENLALLPLFKLRLKKILVVNGGYIERESQYGDDLVAAMELAREILHCSFTSDDGRGNAGKDMEGDVLAAIREKFAKTKEREQKQLPRWFKFKVHYYGDERDENGERKKVGEGDVVIISPRYPDKDVQADGKTWEDCHHRLGESVTIDVEPGNAENRADGCREYYPEPKLWGDGPVLSTEEADKLNGCCCECCHGCCSTKACCGQFPHHVTPHQFFTPKMFRNYHREGYRACMEAMSDGAMTGNFFQVPEEN